MSVEVNETGRLLFSYRLRGQGQCCSASSTQSSCKHIDSTGLAAGSTSVREAQPAVSRGDHLAPQTTLGEGKWDTFDPPFSAHTMNTSRQRLEQRCLLKPAPRLFTMDDRAVPEQAFLHQLWCCSYRFPGLLLGGRPSSFIICFHSFGLLHTEGSFSCIPPYLGKPEGKIVS